MIEMRTYNYADLCDRFLDRPPTLLDTRPTTNNCFAEMKSTRELLKLRSPTRGVDHPDQIVSTANFPGSGIGFKVSRDIHNGRERHLCMAIGVIICLLHFGSLEANAQLSPALAGRTAQANNAITVNQNPAGMARLEGFQAAVDLTVAITDNEFDVDENQSTNTGGDPKNDLDWAAVPQFAASYSMDDRFGDFVDRWSFGFGLSVPQGFGTDYGNTWAGRYFAEETTLVFVSAQPVVAFRATDWLSIGAGVSITYVESDTKVAFPNLADEGDGRFELDVDGASAGPVLSALIEPSPTLRFGLSWRGEIEPELNGKPDFQNLGPGLEAILNASGVLGQSIDLKMRTPQSVQAGFYWRPNDRLGLMADISWLDWSRFGHVEIEVSDTTLVQNTDYDDIWITSIGAEWDFTEKWTGALGFTYVSPAISDSDRTVGMPLDEVFVVGIGAYGQLSPRIGVQTNFLAIFSGDGSIDDQGTLSGRIVGEFERRQTFALQLSFVWGVPGRSLAANPATLNY
jgi:long-chain fatty acid transport protein